MSDMGTIVSFPTGSKTEAKCEPDAELVGAVERLHEEARAGKIQGFIAVTTRNDKTVSRWDYGFHASWPVVGALQASIQVILENVEEREV
nr:hypothetical protein [uncultured Cohaesibacter sp.]